MSPMQDGTGQVKIVLLSFWSVNRWVSQFPMPIANFQFVLISADIFVANCLEAINLVKCQLVKMIIREGHCNDNWKCQLFKMIIREGHCIYVQSVRAGGKSFTHSCQRRCPSLQELCIAQCARTLCKNCARSLSARTSLQLASFLHFSDAEERVTAGDDFFSCHLTAL